MTESPPDVVPAPPAFSDANLDGACGRLQRLHDLYAFCHLVVDFLAGLTFLIGSVLFFWPETETPGVWLFVVGSILFMVKPSLRLAHMLHDRRARRSLERVLSEEARVGLAAFKPGGGTLRV